MTRDKLAITPIPQVKDENIEAYFTDGVLRHFSKDETIINGTNEPEGVYLIKKGFVKAYTITKAGQENLLLIHDAGEFIPLIWALDGIHTEGLFYEAMSDVTVLRTSKEKLRTNMETNMWLCQEILKQSVNIISAYTRRIQTLEFRTARERLVAELLSLAEMFGKPQGNEVLIDAPITHQDIADSINMTRETASRALELLFQEGLIKQVDHFFTVRRVAKLEEASG
ncbi:MAG: Crp/Fnr family transcriptional regulator [Candidatus Saccharibacteria bacterium]|nr:Crp/Fnr family transcriptional regulator [Candidatus Saccharibacteria bacterium]